MDPSRREESPPYEGDFWRLFFWRWLPRHFGRHTGRSFFRGPSSRTLTASTSSRSRNRGSSRCFPGQHLLSRDSPWVFSCFRILPSAEKDWHLQFWAPRESLLAICLFCLIRRACGCTPFTTTGTAIRVFC